VINVEIYYKLIYKTAKHKMKLQPAKYFLKIIVSLKN